ncbi:hypothetical protein HMPREF9622_00940 [Cutibacterium modestum HL037PA3]|uniref:Uncharacterized protein n=1 Tax=Cutibacterium modestum HL044PA1 TaxID=765109 RepID=A0ABP2K6C5_9ACTN|nr:hypothetical protein HMPREF9621_00555 [Cutibacterium modestum HL037PA2]EFS91602.1 hypothetical protein HMPREF9607_02109 [Cutibacterium modestum HL044PA1]EFT16080.1 hypothetical protein HMPREF9622_00940 [Cutibacterium modestum HL037PA3]
MSSAPYANVGRLDGNRPVERLAVELFESVAENPHMLTSYPAAVSAHGSWTTNDDELKG